MSIFIDIKYKNNLRKELKREGTGREIMNSREQLGGVLSNLIHSPHRIIVKA